MVKGDIPSGDIAEGVDGVQQGTTNGDADEGIVGGVGSMSDDTGFTAGFGIGVETGDAAEKPVFVVDDRLEVGGEVDSCSWTNIMWSPSRIANVNGLFPDKKSFTWNEKKTL